VRLVYFAWVRERIGLEEETVDLPQSVKSTGDLLDWLRGRGPEYAHALPDDNTIRIAIDQVHAPGNALLGDAREVALFPPMTGG
jgi:molybdopterin synthase sulfur carrier subunit